MGLGITWELRLNSDDTLLDTHVAGFTGLASTNGGYQVDKVLTSFYTDYISPLSNVDIFEAPDLLFPHWSRI